MIMLSRLYLAFLLMGMSATVSAATETEQVLASLQGYEWQLDRERLAGLPVDSWRTLLDIAQDADQLDYVRARAAASLTAFPNEDVWQFFIQSTQASTAVVSRRRGVDGLCAAFHESRAAALEAALVPLLREADPHLRVQTAACLQRLDTETSREVLAVYRAAIAQDWEARAVSIDRRHAK